MSDFETPVADEIVDVGTVEVNEVSESVAVEEEVVRPADINNFDANSEEHEDSKPLNKALTTALEQREVLVQYSLRLQRKLSLYLNYRHYLQHSDVQYTSTQPVDPSIVEARGTIGRNNNQLRDTEQQYLKALAQYDEIKEMLSTAVSHFDAEVISLFNVLNNQENLRDSAIGSLKDFRRKFCLSLESNGKTVFSNRKINEWEGELNSFDDVLNVERFQYMLLQRRLNSIETSLKTTASYKKKKSTHDQEKAVMDETGTMVDPFLGTEFRVLDERLDDEIEDNVDIDDDMNEVFDDDDWPHVIDFEQLKIENQTLNEKIEERNEDLLKLRKKIDISIQILSHIRKKYFFILNQTEKLRLDLNNLNEELQTHREALSRIRKKRDITKNSNLELRQTTGVMANASLSDDFERKMREYEELQNVLSGLQKRYHDIVDDA
ncbi:hypothetical protein PCE1_000758 [Barthelona sp. PCE]